MPMTSIDAKIFIGCSNDDVRGLDYFFKGIIDEVRIYNRALSEDEIQELYGECEPTCEGEIIRSIPAPGTSAFGIYDEKKYTCI